MKVKFADSFWESLKRLQRRDRWYNVLWRTIRYNIPNFLKNIWYFKKELYDFEGWDYRFNLNLFQRSLEATADYLEHRGIEVDESRMKKVAKIRRVIELLEKDKQDNYLEQAEAELGEMHSIAWWDGDFREMTEEETAHNKKVLNRLLEIEEETWDELWQIIKGKKFTTYEEYDGSDIRGWWD